MLPVTTEPWLRGRKDDFFFTLGLVAFDVKLGTVLNVGTVTCPARLWHNL